MKEEKDSEKKEKKEKKEETKQPEKKKNEEENTSNLHADSTQSTTIALQTAKILMQNPDTKNKVECRIILDTGSHRTYVKESVSRKLGLKAAGTERLQVNTFGSKEAKQKVYRRVNASLLGRHTNGKIDVEALEVQQISSSVVK